MTDLDPRSKPDTRFLGDYNGLPDDWTSVRTDISQRATNLTDGTTYAYEANSARLAIVHHRSIEVDFYHDKANPGVLLNHGTVDGTSYTYRITIDGDDNLEFAANGVLLYEVALGTSAKRYVARWCTRPASGGATGYVSEIDVWNATDSVWVGNTSVSHAAHTTNAAWQFNIGGYGAGVNAYAYELDSVCVRVGNAFHTREESYADFLGYTTPGTITTETRAPVLPLDTTTTVADDGAFAGPALLIGGAAAKRSARRLWSPLLSIQMSPHSNLDNGYGPTAMVRKAIGSTTYRWRMDMLWQRPVPPGATHVNVRLHVTHYTFLGGATLPVYLRLYSLDRLPTLADKVLEPPKPIQLYYVQDDINTGSSSTDVAGVWMDLGELKLSIKNGWTWFALAWSVNADAGDPDESSNGVRIRHITADPIASENTGTQYGEELPEQAP